MVRARCCASGLRLWAQWVFILSGGFYIANVVSSPLRRDEKSVSHVLLDDRNAAPSRRLAVVRRGLAHRHA